MSDVGAIVRDAATTFGSLKSAFDSKNDDKCLEIISKLMKSLIRFPSYLAPTVMSSTRVQEIMLARETLELAVLVSSRQQDTGAMESYYSQLAVYYSDITDPSVPPSERRHLLVGINLMRLLVCSGISQFHTELEGIPKSDHNNIFIKFPIQLERFLMEGSYHKLLHARGQVPSNEYLPVVEMLEKTVRHEIAKCIPKSYPSLTIDAAKRVLMLQSDAEVLALGEHHQWPMAEDKTSYIFGVDDAAAKKVFPFQQVLSDSIHYAAELQKVV